MIYLLLDVRPQEQLKLKGESFKYLVKVRRHSVGDTIDIRFKESQEILYRYKIVAIENRALLLEMHSSTTHKVKASRDFHLAWCIIDPKSIEKVLPTLSEIGVQKISFISCDRSQKNFKLDFKRFERILEASMQQCGRSEYIEFDRYESIEAFMSKFPDTYVLDFCDKTLKNTDDIKRVLIGSEGGFSKSEKEYLKTYNIFRLDTPMVLRSESAAVAISSKVIL